MDRQTTSPVSSAEAVMVGALASGVNGPTWFVLKIAFLLLGLCFSAMLALAFSSSDFVIAGHVLFLVFIGAALFILLNCEIATFSLIIFGAITSNVSLFDKWSTVRRIQSKVWRFLAQTGMVSVEKQMEEIGLLEKQTIEKDKRN